MPEQRFSHEVRAGAGRKVAAPWQQPHSLEIYLLVAALRRPYGAGALCERRRVEDYEVIGVASRAVKLGEQVEHVSLPELHIGEAVLLRVAAGHLDGVRGDIHGGHGLGSGCCGVQRKRAGMREAVEDGTSLRNAADSLAVVLLIEEESGFLTVDVVHGVFYAVFCYFGHAGKVGAKPRASPEALVFLHALKLAYLNVVALVYRGDMLAHIREGLHKQLVERVLYALRAEGQHLRNQECPQICRR